MRLTDMRLRFALMPVEVADQYGVLDTESNRYAWALRRSVGRIAVVAIASGVLGAVLVGSAGTQEVSQVIVNDASTALASSQLQASGFEDLPSREDVLDVLADGLTGDVSSVAVADVANTRAIVLTVDSPTPGDASGGTTQVIEETAAWIREQRAQAASPVTAAIEARQVETAARLEELDQEIATLEEAEALRDAYLDERATLTNQLLVGRSQLESLKQFVDSAATVTVVSSTAQTTDTRVLWFLVGAVLGAFGSSVMVVVRAHADRRVRTRSELKALTNAVPLPPVPSEGNERIPAFGAIRAALTRSTDAAEVLVVPADDRDARRFADALVGQLSNAVVYSPRDGGEPPKYGSCVVLVVSAGRTHSDDVTRTNEYLSAFGCVVVGAVLGDVSPRDLRQSVA